MYVVFRKAFHALAASKNRPPYRHILYKKEAPQKQSLFETFSFGICLVSLWLLSPTLMQSSTGVRTTDPITCFNAATDVLAAV